VFWILVPIAFAGGRIHFVMNRWSSFAPRPWKALEFWEGLHAGGAIIALVLAAPFVARRHCLPIGRLADALAPALAIGVAIGRLGCFLNGCCFGAVCQNAWCLRFAAGTPVHRHHVGLALVPADSLSSLPVHPLQLYFLASALAVVVATLWLLPRRQFDGQVALTGLLLFSVSSALLEPLREHHLGRVYWVGVPQLLWTAIAMTGAAATGLVIASGRRTTVQGRTSRREAAIRTRTSHRMT
jgi:phosphatidylglycerol:prolipoprotein diacylglycerol transferase